jgi:signal transduction histidine kinase
MKLLHKNILANAFASLAIIILGGVITYHFIINKVDKESEEHLMGEKSIVEKKIKEGAPLSVFKNNIGDKIEIEEISQTTGRKPFFKTINEREEYEESGETEEEGEEVFQAKAIVFECGNTEKNFRVTIIKSFDNDEELGKNILFAVGISAMLMVIAIVIVNFLIYKKLWSPFYSILRELQNYDIAKHGTFTFGETQTREFKELSNSLDKMAEKISRDYLSLKEFTENASHEIQTPLAIINSKIEMCLQDKQLTREQAKLLMEAGRAVNTLSNLNKGLITLTKLDNNQVEVATEINLNNLLTARLSLFEDFLLEKNIEVELHIDKNSQIKMNTVLAGILFDNLIKNAVKHNVKGGKIKIETNDKLISISNTGAAPTVSTDKFFERFFKDKSTDSLGLGLAIVKKICEVYKFIISYNYFTGLHVVTLQINS